MKIIQGADEARRTILRRGATTDMALGSGGRATTTAAFGEDLTAAENVRRIIHDVRVEGDAAVRRYTETFDGKLAYESLEVPREEIDSALRRLEPELRSALEFAAGRVRLYHEKQLRRCLASYVDD